MKRFPLYALAVALGLGAVFTGCDTATPQAPAALAQTSSDGETLVRGVLFGDGPAASALPEIWSSSDARTGPAAREATHTADAFLRYAAAERPTFVDRFGQAATSGDAPRVSRALDEATVLMEGFSEASAARGGLGEAGDGEDIIVQIYFLRYVVLPCPNDTGCRGMAGLGQDELALMVAERFAAAPSTVYAGLDGETLARGLVFGVGPAAAVLPELWETPQIQAARAKVPSPDPTALDELEDALRADDAAVFSRFERGVRSGDAQKTLEALDALDAAIAVVAAREAALPASAVGRDHGTARLYVMPPCVPSTGEICPILWTPEGGARSTYVTLAREEIALRIAERLAPTVR